MASMNESLVDPAILAAASSVPAGARAIELRLQRGAGALGAALAILADAVTEAAGPALRRLPDEGPATSTDPALALSADGTGTVRYLAAPVGPEAAPFAALLGWLARPETAPAVVRLAEPTGLEVLVAPGCPHCPRAVHAALALAVHSPLVEVEVVDVTALPERAERHGVSSVPATVLDHRLVLTGVHPTGALASHLAARDTLEFTAAVLDSLAERGRREEAAGFLATLEGATALPRCWAEAGLERRMVLLLAARAALVHDPGALDTAVDGLLPLLRSPEVALRGDTADLLADIGHPAALPALEDLLADSDADVREAADDALAAIRDHCRPGPRR